MKEFLSKERNPKSLLGLFVAFVVVGIIPYGAFISERTLLSNLFIVYGIAFFTSISIQLFRNIKEQDTETTLLTVIEYIEIFFSGNKRIIKLLYVPIMARRRQIAQLIVIYVVNHYLVSWALNEYNEYMTTNAQKVIIELTGYIDIFSQYIVIALLTEVFIRFLIKIHIDNQPKVDLNNLLGRVEAAGIKLKYTHVEGACYLNVDDILNGIIKEMVEIDNDYALNYIINQRMETNISDILSENRSAKSNLYWEIKQNYKGLCSLTFSPAGGPKTFSKRLSEYVLEQDDSLATVSENKL